METMKTVTQNQEAKGLPPDGPEYLHEKEGKPPKRRITSMQGILTQGIRNSSILLKAAGVETQKAKRGKVARNPCVQGQRRERPQACSPAHPEDTSPREANTVVGIEPNSAQRENPVQTDKGEKESETSKSGAVNCRDGELDCSLQSTFISNQLTLSGEKPHVCSECGWGFSQKCYLIRYQKTHAEVKPYICLKYGWGFSQKSHLIKHQWTHSDEKPYICRVCG
ncbi:LOW QUALITY PROTEIN: hypothetical protein MC885_017395 [Smutsia gigantea]|nr:LOW QUALITY PROTEIN: hypothetical protein MC885_017395 [Smutsia gigantea]